MPSKQQLETALRNADAAGDTAAATALANALRAGKYDNANIVKGTYSDVPQVDEDGVPISPDIETPAKRPMSLTENPIAGAVETAYAALPGGVAGMAGQMIGSVKGIGQSILDGTYGTQAGADAAEAEAQRMSESFAKPFQPTTKTGQEYTQALGEAAEPFAAAAPFSHELAIIGNSARAALPMAGPVSQEVSQAIRDVAQKYTPPSSSEVPLRHPQENAAPTNMGSDPVDVNQAASPINSQASQIVDSPQDLTAQTKQVANAFADAGMKNRVDEITANVTLNPERMAAAERLGLQPPIATLSDDRALHEIAGALAASPGSKASADLSAYHKSLTDRSKQLIEEAGGELDKGVINSQVKEKIDTNIKQLTDQAANIYNEINRRVPDDTIVNSKPLVRELNRRGDKSQHGIDGLSKVERDVYRIVRGKPTYFDVDNLRKDIGESIGGIKGSYPKQSTAMLKDMYGKLTELQEGVANEVGQGAGHLWNEAKDLDNNRFALQDNAMFLFGRDLNSSVMPKVIIGLKNLSRGDAKAFNNVVANVPPDMRRKILMSGLDSVINKSIQGESAISPVQFNKWYGDLSSSPSNKKLLFDNLPQGAGKRLDDMFKLSQGLQNITNRIVRTGIVHDAFKDFDKTSGLIQKLYGAADRLDSVPVLGPAIGSPTLRIGSSILKMATKEKTPAIEAADNLLADPDFRSAVLDYQKNANPSSPIQEKLKKKPSYKKYIDAFGDELKNNNLIDNSGLIPFLLAPAEEGKNDD